MQQPSLLRDGAAVTKVLGWIPEAKHDTLIYVSDTVGNDVSVYAWRSHKLVGMLAGIKPARTDSARTRAGTFGS